MSPRARFSPINLLGVIVQLAIVCSAGDAKPPQGIPVHAWFSIPPAFSTPEHYRELAGAGFSTSFTMGFENVSEALKALDAANETGVKLFVHCPDLLTNCEETVKKLCKHPALAGYHLQDEPSAAAFAGLAAWQQKINAVDADHPCYINLFPNVSNARLGTDGYAKYVEQFVQTISVPFISFDYYPTKFGKLEADVFTNLEIISSAARKAKKPFWGFYQAVLWNTMPPRTLAKLRLESFINLAYGAQCIQVFTYWLPPPNGDEKFHDAPISMDGKRTPVYDLVKQTNGEIRALSRVFLNASVVKVSHAGKAMEPQTTAFTPEAPIQSLDVADGNALVSLLKNGKSDYVVIVNKDILASLKLKIRFTDTAKMLEIRKDGTDRPVTAPDFTIEPGDILIFQVRP